LTRLAGKFYNRDGIKEPIESETRYMIAVTEHEIYQTAHFTPFEERDRGIDAQFIRINGRWGIKFFKNEALRNKTYDFQNRAAGVGIAPRIGQCFELEIPFRPNDDPIEVFGYVTECVSETYADRMAYKLYGIPYEECSYGQSDEIHDRLYDDYEYKRLIEKLYDIRISNRDIHANNVGYLRGKLVCIDFSDEHEL